jgi:hypothetical protein
MPRTLHADGNTGKVYIYNNDADPATYADPDYNQLGDLHFHSDLSYLGNTQVLTATVGHPQRTRSSSTSKGLFGSETFYNPQQGSQTYNIGANPFGYIPPFVVFYGTSQLPAGSVVHQAGESVRAVSVYATTTNFYVYESWATFQNTLISVSRTYKIYMFQTLFTGAGAESIRVAPNLFRAGFGKLSTDYRYVRKAPAPDFYVTDGKTADVSGGGLKVVLPDGSVAVESSTYTGGFAGSVGDGVEL